MVQKGTLFIHQTYRETTDGTKLEFDVKPRERGGWSWNRDRREDRVARVDGELVIDFDIQLAKSRSKNRLHQTPSSQ
jgi:hypothetical protein